MRNIEIRPGDGDEDPGNILYSDFNLWGRYGEDSIAKPRTEDSCGTMDDERFTHDSELCICDSCDACTRNIPMDIDDGDPCTYESCDPCTGETTHEPMPVDDGNNCTDDGCDCEHGESYRVLTVTQDGKRVIISEEYFENGTTVNVGDTVKMDISFLKSYGAADRFGEVEGTDPHKEYVVTEVTTRKRRVTGNIQAHTSPEKTPDEVIVGIKECTWGCCTIEPTEEEER